MPASEARIAANRANALKSTGPRTEEGKAASRRNAFKHGMAGEGVVLPPVDSAEVERRARAMQAEIRPATEMGRYLVGRLAELTVRVERCSRHERACTGARVLGAGAALDEARLADVDETLAYLAREPATQARKLRSTPEGVDRLIAALLELRDELDAGRWDWTYGDKLANLTGRRWAEVPVPQVRALSEAIIGNPRLLLPSEGEGLADDARAAWARDAMAGLIDGEVASLLEHRATLDLAAIEEDRAGAADRALFDPSREATLARRYEAAAERGVFRALGELRQVEAEAAGPEPEPEPEPGPLGSSRDESPGGVGEPAPAAAPGSRGPVAAAGADGPRPISSPRRALGSRHGIASPAAAP